VSSMPPVADVVAKVSDFGLSTEAELALEFRGAVVDNPTWTAPEILSKKKFTIKVDVYSFGVILWEMITRKFFFGEIKFMSELEALVRSGFFFFFFFSIFGKWIAL
jgi:serine/threonine protein kinase